MLEEEEDQDGEQEESSDEDVYGSSKYARPQKMTGEDQYQQMYNNP